MNCYYHPDTAGSASCHECGRTLCNSCTDRFTPIMCEGCFTTVQSTERQNITKCLTLSSIMLIVGFLSSLGYNSFGIIMISTYFFASIPFGWSFISRIMNGWILFMGIRGWLIYPFVKLFASWAIGGFVAPFYLSKMIKKLKEIDRDSNAVQTESSQTNMEA